MKKKIKLSLIFFIPITIIIGLFAFVQFAFTGFLSELEVSPDLKIKFYWFDNWDLNYDIYYKVYQNGWRVFKSDTFFYQFGYTMEPPKFNYHKLGERYVAIYNTQEPTSFLIVIDLKEKIYGKKNRSGPLEYHKEFNERMLSILDLFKKSLGDNSLVLDGFHYNFQPRTRIEQSSAKGSPGQAL